MRVIRLFFSNFAMKMSIMMNKRTILTLSAALALAAAPAVADENEPMLMFKMLPR